MNIKNSKDLKAKDAGILLKKLTKVLQIQMMIKEYNQSIQ